ncbi:hypothetical protein ACIP88_34435 [Streptomyces uncialis]|uniref:hypothetical protein n=1 Tax=Streptomyces uncialis TaxID=1048205 RepID=UPI0038101ED2
MPSEGKPQPIDTAVITSPGDIPTNDLWLLADRRERHTSGNTSRDTSDPAGDALAALAIGTAIRGVLDDQEQHLVREGLRHGTTWGQLAAALGLADPQQSRAAFITWSQQLPDDEAAEAVRLAAEGRSR